MPRPLRSEVWIGNTTFSVNSYFPETLSDTVNDGAGIVKRVIIKDMSRFGRDYLQVGMYTEIMFPELTPHILHEFVEKIVVHAATDPHSKTNRKQEVDIYYKGIGVLEMSKVFDAKQK